MMPYVVDIFQSLHSELSFSYLLQVNIHYSLLHNGLGYEINHLIPLFITNIVPLILNPYRFVGYNAATQMCSLMKSDATDISCDWTFEERSPKSITCYL